MIFVILLIIWVVIDFIYTIKQYIRIKKGDIKEEDFEDFILK